MGAYLTLHKYNNKFYEINQIKNEGSPLLAQNEVRADIFSGSLAVFQSERVASAGGRKGVWREFRPSYKFLAESVRIFSKAHIGKIKDLKFPTFWFDSTPQGKFMLNIAFGQSKYYIDNLSENIKRGQRAKLRKGIWPNFAPLGYLNIVSDKHGAVQFLSFMKIVQKLKHGFYILVLSSKL